MTEATNAGVLRSHLNHKFKVRFSNEEENQQHFLHLTQNVISIKPPSSSRPDALRIVFRDVVTDTVRDTILAYYKSRQKFDIELLVYEGEHGKVLRRVSYKDFRLVSHAECEFNYADGGPHTITVDFREASKMDLTS